MGELGFNKFFGALLATVLLILGLNEVANIVFSSGGGHHKGHHYDTLNEWAEDKFHGYRIEIAEAASGGNDEPEDVFDLGLMLASADIAAGERAMRQCAQCHTWDDGGANGTGPNLYGMMNADIAANGSFAYSGALAGIDGDWTYQAMNDWLTNPGAFARGNKMSFAGLRSPRKDAERVNIIAYLASISPNAAPFPAPLVTEASAEAASDVVETTGEVIEAAEGTIVTVDGASVEVADETATAEDTGNSLLEQIVETVEDGGEAIVDTATDATEGLVETVEDAVTGEQ